MRAVLGFASWIGFCAWIGCTPVRQYPPNVTSSDVDAWMEGTDAWNQPGHDAGSLPDAWTPPPDDTGSSCPTYTNDVEAIYQMHCATCHTTGGDPHFGSSYTVANSASSSCGTSMAQCTIDRGQAGGDMAFRDPLGGFGPSEVAIIQAWIGCNRPR